MSKEQIKEMARHCHFREKGKCLLLDDETVKCDMNCDMYEFAEHLYNAGYRKQSEGRWTPRHKDTQAFCTKCGALRDIETQEFWSFCPNCGAKMKGGAE